jgi:hypothetical protein
VFFDFLWDCSFFFFLLQAEVDDEIASNLMEVAGVCETKQGVGTIISREEQHDEKRSSSS